ncbi:GloB Zn-dependent hydrolases, including glyoxylases [Rhabdaerophilaceae bacterium]
MQLSFNTARPETGSVITVAPGIRRLVAPNTGPFTFTGTCTYLLGDQDLVVIDPGPESDDHLLRLLAEIGDARVAGILVTHTHRDHSPLARALKARTGASIFGCAPHRPSRALRLGEVNPLESSGDTAHQPDRALAHGERVSLGEWDFEILATPGHTANHLGFALPSGVVFSGDHIMAWSTTIVAPPDGAMGPYLASLELMASRESDQIYFPGHGGPVSEPQRFARAIYQHRRHRENQIMERLSAGPLSVMQLVEANYPALDERLKGAAALSVFAHLEDLVDRAVVLASPMLAIDAMFERA